MRVVRECPRIVPRAFPVTALGRPEAGGDPARHAPVTTPAEWSAFAASALRAG